MKSPRWVSKKALLLLHAQSLARFGGGTGMRDEGLLDSALARPQQVWSYEPEASLARLAAALGYGLCKNHPFVDGNKRIAFLSVGVFLAINGKALEVAQPLAIAMFLNLAAGGIDETSLARWIAQHS